MRLAYTHDWLYKVAGAERVLKAMLDVKKAPVYTLFYNKQTANALEINEIYPSFLNALPNIEKIYKNLLPFYPLAIKSWNLWEYDVIISSSHSVAKGFKKREGQIHICYCHTPMRYIWDLYLNYKNSLKSYKRLPFSLTALALRNWDVKTSKNVDYFIANSKFVADRIKRIYKRDAEVIYPPVDIDRFEPEEEKSDYYVFVGRLFNAYKRVDLAIKAFNEMGKRLIVIGDGDDFDYLKSMAKPNIEFTGWLTQKELHPILRKAKALILPSIEDFGIVSVEAQACGTPVIAYFKSGARETIIPFKTGVFFFEHDVSSIIKAVKTLEDNYRYFDVQEMRKNAERFSKAVFMSKFKQFLKNLSLIN